MMMMICRISNDYFEPGKSALKTGCYFLINARWLQRWRQWLQGDLPYASLGPISAMSPCPHGGTLIPGYMEHFIQGISTIPCSVRNDDQ